MDYSVSYRVGFVVCVVLGGLKCFVHIKEIEMN